MPKRKKKKVKEIKDLLWLRITVMLQSPTNDGKRGFLCGGSLLMEYHSPWDKIDPHLDNFLEDFGNVVLSAELSAPGWYGATHVIEVTVLVASMWGNMGYFNFVELPHVSWVAI